MSRFYCVALAKPNPFSILQKALNYPYLSSGLRTPSMFFVAHMRINHRGLQIGVSQEFLNRPDVIPLFKKMCCKAVTQCMDRCLFCYPYYTALNSKFPTNFRIFSLGFFLD